MGRSEGWVILGVSSLFVGAVLGAFLLGRTHSRPAVQEDRRRPAPTAIQRKPPPVSRQEPPAESFNFDREWTQFLADFGQKNKGAVLSGNLSGDGQGQSEYFTVTRGDQFVIWGLNPNASVKTLIVEIKDQRGKHVEQFIPSTAEKMLGFTRLRLNPGTYYLDVTAFGGWKVAVIEY